MKKLLTILLVLISFSTFAQFEAGEYINSDTVKKNGVNLYLEHLKMNPQNNGKIARQQGDSVVWGKELDSVYLEETDTSGILDKDNFFWSANKKYELITPHIGGGTGDNVYMTNVNSDISGYKKTSYTNDIGITSFSATASADTVLVQQFLFDGQLSTSILDAGGWIVRTYCKVSSIAGVSKFKYEFFVYDDADSTIFSFYSDEINNTAFQYNEYTSFQSAFNLGKSTYRLGVRVYFLTTSPANITGTFRVGDGETSYINTPIALRHVRIRNPNEDPNVQHMTADDKNAVNRYKIDSASYLTSEVDGSTTNEIQDLSRAGNTLSLSGDGTTVDLSDLVNPDLTGYRLKTDHDSLSNLDEKSYNSLTDKPASLPASDVYPWAKAATKPTYTYSEVGAQPSGNYFRGGMIYTGDDINSFNLCGAGFYVPTTLNIPFPNYGTIFNIDGYGTGTGTGWNTQLAFSTANDDFAIRSSINNNTTWSTWKNIYHSGNSNKSTVNWAANILSANSISTDTVKIDGVPLLLNTFKQGNLGGAGNIFYSTGASSQPASGSINQVIGGNSLSVNYLPKWDGGKFANSVITEVDGKIGINRQNPSFFDLSTEHNGTIAATKLRLQDSYLDNGWFGVQLRAYDNLIDGHDFVIEGRNSAKGNFTPYFFMNSIGFFGINTTLPTERLDVNGNLIADILKSRIPTGTPPLVVASSTKVDSLNVGLLDGKKASDFQLKSDTLTFDATLSDLADSSAAIRSLANTKAVVSGTNNYIMKKTGANTLGNSNLIDYGSFVSSNVRFYAPTFYVGSTNYSDGYINLGPDRPGNNYAFIDLIGDQTYVDYGLRLVRDNTGANASSMLTHRGKGELLIRTEDSGRLAFVTKNTTAVTIDTLQNSGFGTLTPAARIHSQSTGTQARLGYDETKYTDLSTGSTGNLTIDPTGDTVKVVGAVNSTGGFFKNGVEITGGGGGISNIGITVPTGLSVSPANLTANGTFAISYQPGYTYFTDIERSIYSNANQKRITSASFSGTTTKTLTLSQVDGGVLQASFTDLQGTSKWTDGTYGIYYNSGNVSVGTSSTNEVAKLYSYTNSSIVAVYGNNNGTGHGVVGNTQSGTAIVGNAKTGFGGDFTGLGCRATKFYVLSLNTAPSSATDTGTTGEIRFTSDYIYVCVATNTWKRTQISTW